MKLEARRLSNGNSTDHDDEAITERIVISLPPGLLARVQDYRFANRYNSQSACVRKLLELALDAETKPRN
jgi:Arc/MetJ-type ribon-helix-helix transcriptional regulator